MAELDEGPPEAYFNFKGMKASGEFDELPRLGDRMRFELVAECVDEPHLILMADGHRRRLIGMRVLSVEPGEITEAPADPQLSMADDLFAIGSADPAGGED